MATTTNMAAIVMAMALVASGASAQTSREGSGKVPPSVGTPAAGQAAASGDPSATNQGDPGAYPLKDGGTYKPPAEPFRSPAMETTMDDRT